MIQITIGRKDFTGLFKKIQERAGRIATNKAAVWNVLKGKLDKYAKERTKEHEIKREIEQIDSKFHMEYIIYKLKFETPEIEKSEYEEMQGMFEQFKYGEEEKEIREETAKAWYSGLGRAGKIAQNILSKASQSVVKGLGSQSYDEILLKKFEIVIDIKKSEE